VLFLIVHFICFVKCLEGLDVLPEDVFKNIYNVSMFFRKMFL